MLVAQGKLVELVETENAAAVMGINTPQELATAERIMGVASAHGARPGA